jgi:hypothetical protein
MIIHQTIDFNTMFRHSLIINDLEIDEKHQNSSIPTGQNESMDEMASPRPNKFEFVPYKRYRPGACIIKLITAVIYSFHNKLECLSLASLSSIF